MKLLDLALLSAIILSEEFLTLFCQGNNYRSLNRFIGTMVMGISWLHIFDNAIFSDETTVQLDTHCHHCYRKKEKSFDWNFYLSTPWKCIYVESSRKVQMQCVYVTVWAKACTKTKFNFIALVYRLYQSPVYQC